MAMTKARPTRATRVLLKPLNRPGRGARRIPTSRGSAVIDWAAYIDGERVDTPDVADAVQLVRAPRSSEYTTNLHTEAQNRFVWVGLHEPDAEELERLAEVFGLHPLAV